MQWYEFNWNLVERKKSLPCYQWHAYRKYRHLLAAYKVFSHSVCLLPGRIPLINAHKSRDAQHPNEHDRIDQVERSPIIRHIHCASNLFCRATIIPIKYSHPIDFVFRYHRGHYSSLFYIHKVDTERTYKNSQIGTKDYVVIISRRVRSPMLHRNLTSVRHVFSTKSIFKKYLTYKKL